MNEPEQGEMRGDFNDATGGRKNNEFHELIKLILPLSLYERRASKKEKKRQKKGITASGEEREES